MVAERAIAQEHADSFRWWYLPSWLGLDAPCVVSTWTWAISRQVDASLEFRSAGALFLVVWSIYLADRLIDVSRCSDWQQATGRLRFGRRYRWLFLGCLTFCACGIVCLLWAGLPSEVIVRGAIVALALVLHFALFVAPVFRRQKLAGKEFGVGLFFALGAYACLGYESGMLPLLGSIGLVVAFNCLVIAARDAESDRVNDVGGASHWWSNMQRDLVWAGVGLTPVFGLLGVVGEQMGFYFAVTGSFGLLRVLHRWAWRLRENAVRALADFALFTPLVAEGVRVVGHCSI